jgi:prepilin-type processing-associated H-X9-DG protein
VHGNSRNALYFDGHVDSRKVIPLSSSSSPSGTKNTKGYF